jgi:hypothetical protein
LAIQMSISIHMDNNKTMFGERREIEKEREKK